MLWQSYLLALCGLTVLRVQGQALLPEDGPGLTPTETDLPPDGTNILHHHGTGTESEVSRGARYVETLLSRAGSHLAISRVELSDTTRVKRGVHDRPKKWSHKIPYVIDPSFAELGERNTKILKRAIQRIMDNVCVVYEDVTDTWNSSDPNWLKDHGFENNAYILFKMGTGCTATTGYGSGNEPRKVYPCRDFQINSHEVLHTLGGSHSQQIPRRDNYITIYRDNIQSDLQYTYNRIDNENYFDMGFDSESTLIYNDKTWSRNGLETYVPIRDDLFELEYSISTDDTVFYELSLLYECNALYCKNSQVDCGEGYHSLHKGECKCICPPEFDPATNCKELFNQPNTALTWPKTPMAVLAGGPDNQCPKEFNSKPGWFTFDGIKKPLQLAVPVLMPYQNNTLLVPVCTKDGPKPPQIDWESWPPGGTLCVIQAKGASCGGAFDESTMWFVSMDTVQHNGSLGEIEITDNNITVKLCCKKQESSYLRIDLPNSDPFRLIAIGNCPRITGMREYKGLVNLFTEQKSVEGSTTPQFNIFKKELQIYQCYYLPPVYGCNKEVTLNSKTRSVTITTPGFGTSREPNRRCLYYFHVPSNSKIRITFNEFDLDTDDKLLVKRYYKWQVQYRVDNSKWPYQFMSEGEFLLMEYWSGWTDVTNQGLKFTADVILPEDFCYNPVTKGEDYLGDTSVSETYEDCLPWSETTECTDFPTVGMSPIWLLNSGKSCRNPDGQILQPWCYTYRNGTNCHKRYCDACNFQSPVDAITSCADLVAEDPEFCKSGIQRFGCFKTCGFPQASTSRKTCSAPNIPSDGTLAGPGKSTYLEGEKVVVNCSSQELDVSQGEMLCTRSGWTVLENACDDGSCKDRISTTVCERTMTLYPNFCTDSRFMSHSEQVCRKSCGACPENSRCKEPKSKTYSRISENATITTGESMNFTCNPGYYYVSGNLQRACSSSGTLLGVPPVCQSKPVPQDVNLNGVISRKGTYPKGLAMLLVDQNLRVPFNGVINTWYYYCNSPGLIHLLVYRKKGSSYEFVGSNNVTCQAGWKWALNVPEGSQIPVQQGDIFGIYSPDSGTFSVNDCSNAEEIIARNPFIVSKTPLDFTTATFAGEKCSIPSAGYRVVPATFGKKSGK